MGQSSDNRKVTVRDKITTTPPDDPEICKCGKKTSQVRGSPRIKCANCTRYYHKLCANPGFAKCDTTLFAETWWCNHCIVLQDIESGNKELISSLTTKLAPQLESRFNDVLDKRLAIFQEETLRTVERTIQQHQAQPSYAQLVATDVAPYTPVRTPAIHKQSAENHPN